MDVLAFVIGVALLVVGLAVSIALHELGHFAPAKKFGVRVGQFMIGFGPTLFSRRRGETEFGLKAIPLGGYISMAGMYPPASGKQGAAGGGFFALMVQDAQAANAETVHGDGDPRTFFRLPIYKRVIIMLGGPVMNLLFAGVLFTVLLSGIGTQVVTTTLASVSECIIPASAERTECVSTDPAGPAAQAGLAAGDRVVAIDGEPMADFAAVVAAVSASPGTALTVQIERDGALQNLVVTPLEITRETPDAEGTVRTENVGVMGVRAEVAYQREPIWAGAVATAESTGRVVQVIARLPVLVWETAVSTVTGAERDPNGPLSIVGAGVIAGEVAAAEAPIVNRVAGILALLASLNIALAVFNLIPLLPLDGGHVAVALWDGITRIWARIFRRPPPRPVDATKLVPLTFVVVITLLVMGAVLIIADVINPISLLG